MRPPSYIACERLTRSRAIGLGLALWPPLPGGVRRSWLYYWLVSTSHLYFAFIRAINTGGRRLGNDQIIEPFVDLGFKDVAAYQAAGNVAFRSGDPKPPRPEPIETALAEAYGFEAPVFVRHIDEIRAVVDRRPFSEEEVAGTSGRIQVSFLRTSPKAATIAEIQALVPGEDRVVFSGREWFWLPTHGISDSQLSVGAIEALAGPMTMRTLGTVSRMLKKYSS